MQTTTPTTNLSPLPVLARPASRPALLVAFASVGLDATDRFSVADTFVVGRSSTCNLTIRDKQISKQHFQITCQESGTTITDLGSTNGTFINGYRMEGTRKLLDQTVVRVGQVVLVFVEDGGLLLEPPCPDTYGMAGLFHTTSLIHELNEAALSTRSILLAGPTGSGKELAARAVNSITTKAETNKPFVAHNAGLFATEDEATSTLFGVGAKVFSGVDARMGLIDKANGGLLFLDEIDNLPIRVQQSLLRVIEDGKTKRIGETDTHQVNVRFVFASNKDAPNCCLTPDLFARLRVVQIPSLSARVADIPSIFDAVLLSALNSAATTEIGRFPLLFGDHYESLCLDGFKNDNVRGLIDLADKLVTRISAGVAPDEALASTFNERFKNGLVVGRATQDTQIDPSPDRSQRNSHYEKNKETIIHVYREQKSNASATERVLREKGISCSRRWITTYIDRWGIR